MEEIVVIGSSNTDLVIKTQRIPEPGETVLGGVLMTVSYTHLTLPTTSRV